MLKKENLGGPISKHSIHQANPLKCIKKSHQAHNQCRGNSTINEFTIFYNQRGPKVRSN